MLRAARIANGLRDPPALEDELDEPGRDVDIGCDQGHSRFVTWTKTAPALIWAIRRQHTPPACRFEAGPQPGQIGNTDSAPAS